MSVIAMDLKQDGRTPRNPRELNQFADSVNAFPNETSPLISSTTLAGAYGSSYRTVNISEVWNLVASGEPVIVYGSLSPGGSNCHAQLIWGHDGARYWTKDPWYDWANQDQPMRVHTGSGPCASAGNFRVFQ